uniref:Uncharacterized protein n=1 Tax=Seriola lalandi dorsalis TaxID=1841481 RepID=A0A3B4YHL0_SERLL
MSRGVIQPSQQKLAEKLTILNDRGIGMLTRVYNIKKVRTHTHMFPIYWHLSVAVISKAVGVMLVL